MAFAPLRTNKKVTLIGAPFCEGQDLQGADLAPTAMRSSGLKSAVERLGWQFQDMGDLDFASHLKAKGWGASESLQAHCATVRCYEAWVRSGMKQNFSTWSSPYQAAAKPVVANAVGGKGDEKRVENEEYIGHGLELVHQAVSKAVQAGSLALTIGGDHSIASGSILASKQRYPNLRVIWVDAHADANTPETSPSMHYHGMPVAHLLGWFKRALEGFEWFPSGGCLLEQHLVYIGLRDIDPEEGRMLRDSNVHVFTMRDVDKLGIARVVDRAIEVLDPNGHCPLHLSLDIDAVDPRFAPGTGTAARGGLSYREVHYICEEMADTGRLVSMDLVEVNPGMDPAPLEGPMHGDDPDMKPSSPTVQLAVELVLSALGKSILPPAGLAKL